MSRYRRPLTPSEAEDLAIVIGFAEAGAQAAVDAEMVLSVRARQAFERVRRMQVAERGAELAGVDRG